MNQAEKELGPRSSHRDTGQVSTVPESAGREIASSLSAGKDDAVGTALEWSKQLADVDPLFRWFAEGTLNALAAGNPHPLLAINAGRWGVHLLGPAKAERLIEMIFERNAALMERTGGGG
jgi:hypothetical protein